MKKIILFCLTLLLSTCFLFTQQDGSKEKLKFNSPFEIIKIMTNSKETFNVKLIDSIYEQKDRTNNIIVYNYYVKKDSNDNPVLSVYDLNKNEQEILNLAESEFAKKDYRTAREQYLKLYEMNKNLSFVMVYIGQTFSIENNFDEAIKWYLKSIETNYIDYKAHWFLADVLVYKNRKDEALKEITIANVLNRNNPRLQLSMNDIYKGNGKLISNWNFNPQSKIYKDSKGINIEFGKNWIMYSMVKALWDYDEDYMKEKGFNKSNCLVPREKEALLNFYSGCENTIKSGDSTAKSLIEFRNLKEAIENKYFNEFMFYEVILPDYPQIAMTLEKEFFDRIVEYVMNIRNKYN
jgi:tetratricopeptide (TPR) repeat protein